MGELKDIITGRQSSKKYRKDNFSNSGAKSGDFIGRNLEPQHNSEMTIRKIVSGETEDTTGNNDTGKTSLGMTVNEMFNIINRKTNSNNTSSSTGSDTKSFLNGNLNKANSSAEDFREAIKNPNKPLDDRVKGLTHMYNAAVATGDTKTAEKMQKEYDELADRVNKQAEINRQNAETAAAENAKLAEQAEKEQKFSDKYKNSTLEQRKNARIHATTEELDWLNKHMYDNSSSKELEDYNNQLNKEANSLWNQRDEEQAYNRLKAIEDEQGKLKTAIDNAKLSEQKKKEYDDIVNNDINAKTVLQKYYALQEYSSNQSLVRSEENTDGVKNQVILDDYNYINKLSGKERNQIVKDFNNLKKEGYDTESLYKWYKRERDAESAAETTRVYTDYADKHPVLGSLQSVGVRLTGAVPDAVKYISTNLDKKYNGGDGYINPEETGTAISDAMRAKVSENINNDFGSFLYNTGMSMADFASLLPLNAVPGGQALSLGIMGTSAGVGAANEVINNGGTIDNAVKTGIASGIAETLFEKLSLEQLSAFKASGKSTFRAAVGNVLKGAFTEGSEEAFTDLANRLTDDAINKDLSSYNISKKKFMEQGMNEAEAENAASWDFWKNVGLDFAGGAISGGVLNLATAGVNLAGAKIDMAQNKESNIQTGKAVMADENFDLDLLIRQGLATDKNDRAYNYAKHMQQLVETDDEGKISAGDVGNLMYLINREVAQNPELVNKIAQVKKQNTQEQGNKTVNVQNEQNPTQQNTVQNVQNTAQNGQQNAEQAQASTAINATKKADTEAIGKMYGAYAFGKKHPNGIIATDTSTGKVVKVALKSLESSAKINRNDEENTLVFNTNDGRQVNADSITFSDRQLDAVVHSANEFDTYGARNYISNFEEWRESPQAQKMTDEEMLYKYNRAYSAAYSFGREGVKLDSLKETSEYKILTNILGEQIVSQALSTGRRDVDINTQHHANRLTELINRNGRADTSGVGVYADSGTEVSHIPQELIGALGNLATKTGRNIIISDRLADGVNGVARDGNIILSSEISSQKILATALHEAGHMIKKTNPTEWRTLSDFVSDYLVRKGVDLNKMIDRTIERYGNRLQADEHENTRDAALEEIVCDTLMSIASDEKALNIALSTKQNKSKIAAAIKSLIAKVKDWLIGKSQNYGAKAFAKDLEVLENLAKRFSEAADTAKENITEQTEVQNGERLDVEKYSMGSTDNIVQAEFEKKVDEIEKNTYNSDDAVIMGITPNILQKIGLAPLPLAMTKNHIYSVAVSDTRAKSEGRYHKNTNYHNLGFDAVKDIYNKISDPLMVIAHPDFAVKKNKSKDSTHKVVVLVNLSVDGKQVIAPITVDYQGMYNNTLIDVNLVATYFDKDNINDYIKEAIALETMGKTGFFYLDKKRTQNIFKKSGYQLPSQLKNSGSNIIIRPIDDIVNKKINNITQSKQFIRWFGDWQNSPAKASKVVDNNGEPLVLYHQTEKEFTTFDTKQKGSGEFDSEMPTGIFMKPTNNDIGVGGNIQMPLYASIKNPLIINNRSELVKFYDKNVQGYTKAKSAIDSVNEEYKAKFNEEMKRENEEYQKLWNAKKNGEISEEEYQKSISRDALDEIMEEWENKVNEASRNAKALVDDYFKNSNYDGVIVNNDVGSFGRSTKTFIAFENTQVKSATDNIGTFDGNNPDIRYSLDEDYSDAVKNNDTETAQKLVNDKAMSWGAYSENGKTPTKLYHGTESFGFTAFDLSKMDDGRSIFLTNNPEIASTYSGVDNLRKISEKDNIDVDKLSVDDTAKLLNAYAQNLYFQCSFTAMSVDEIKNYKNTVDLEINYAKNILKAKIKDNESNPSSFYALHKSTYVDLLESLTNHAYDKISTPLDFLLTRDDTFTIEQFKKLSNTEQNIRLLNKLSEIKSDEPIIVQKKLGGYVIEPLSIQEAKDELKANINKGNYSLFAKIENPLIIDASKSNWNEIDVKSVLNTPFGDAIKSEYGEDYFNYGTQHLSTREVSKYAKQAGYDGVIFKNLKDNGGRNSNVSLDTVSDVYIAFNPNNVKSADAITYDNDGKVIPLSERFDGNEDDIRYSLDEDYDYTDEKAGAIHDTLNFSIDDEYDDLFDFSGNDEQHIDFDKAVDKNNPELTIEQIYHHSARNVKEGLLAGKGIKPEQKKIYNMVKSVMRSYHINPNAEMDSLVTEYVDALNTFIDSVQNDKSSFTDAFESFVLKCRDTLRYSTQLDEQHEAWAKEIRDELKGTTLLIPDNAIDTIKENYGSVGKYKKALFGKINVKLEHNARGITGKAVGSYIEDIGSHLEELGGRSLMIEDGFDWDSDSGYRMLDHIMNYVLAPQYVATYDGKIQSESTIDAAAIQMAFDTTAEYLKQQGKTAVMQNNIDKRKLRDINKALRQAEKAKTALNAKTVENYKTKLLEQKEKYNAQKEIYRQRYNALKDKKSEQAKRYHDKIHELEELSKNQKAIIEADKDTLMARYTEKREQTKYRQMLGKKFDKLVKKFDAKSKNTENIPESLKRPILNVLIGFKESADPGQYKNGGKKTIPKYFGAWNNVAEIGERVRSLYEEYKSLAPESSGKDKSTHEGMQYSYIDINSIAYNEQTAQMLEIITERFAEYATDENGETMYDADGKPIKVGYKNIFDLDSSELRLLYDTMTALEASLSQATEIIVNGQRESIAGAAAKALDEISNVNYNKGVNINVLSKNTVGNKINAALSEMKELSNRFVATSLDPVRYGRFLSGYNDDSVVAKLFRDLHEGDVKREKIMQKAYTKVQSVAYQYSEKDLAKIQKDDVKEFDFRDTKTGERVKVSQGIIMSIYLTDQQSSGRQHLLADRLNHYTVLPDLDSANSRRHSKQEKAKSENHHKVRFTFEDLQHIKRYVESNKMLREISGAINEVLNNELQQEINEVSMSKYGMLIATVRNYFPISVYSDGAAYEKDFSAEFNDLRMKSRGFVKRRESSSAPIVIDDVFRVFNRHTNSVAEWCGLTTPIENFKKVYNWINTNSLNGTTLHEAIMDKYGKAAEHYIDKLMGDLQKSKDTIDNNLLTRMQGNYMGAALLLNPGAMIKQFAAFPTANAYFGTKNVATASAGGMWKVDLKKYAEYTPYLWYRAEGNGTVVGELSREAGVVGGTKSKMDIMGKVDRYVVGCLLKAAELHVEQTTNLKKGSDAFYKKVVRQFEKCVDETQPNNMVTSKPQFIRNNVLKILSMSAFRSQTMAIGNTIIDSYMEYRTKSNDYKSAKTPENKSAKKVAMKKFAKSLIGATESALLIGGLTTLVNMLLWHKWDDERDDKGNVTAENIFKSILGYSMESFAGTFTFGDTAYSAIAHMIDNDRPFYGLDSMSLENVNNFIENISKGDYISAATLLGDCFGLPASNIKRIALSLTSYFTDLTKGRGEIISDNKGNINTTVLVPLMINATIDGDTDKAQYYEQLYVNTIMDTKGKTEKEARDMLEQKVITALSKNNDDIEKAAVARANGDLNTYESLINKVSSYGFGKNDVIKASSKVISNIIANMKKEGITDEDAAKSDLVDNQGFTEQGAEYVFKKMSSSTDDEKSEESIFDSTGNDDTLIYKYTDAFEYLKNGDTVNYEKVEKYLMERKGKTKNQMKKLMQSASRTDPMFEQYISASKSNDADTTHTLYRQLLNIYGSESSFKSALRKYQAKIKKQQSK